MDAITRRIRLLQMIPRKEDGYITIPQMRQRLTTRFEIEKLERRTLERDMIILSHQFNIECDDSCRPFRWYWFGKELVDIPAMGRDTALAFLLVKDYLTPILPRAALSSLSQHFNRAANTLKDGKTQACLRPRDRFWDIPVPKIDSAFDNL